MQRKSLIALRFVIGTALLSFQGCASAQDVSVRQVGPSSGQAQCAPNDVPCIWSHQDDDQPYHPYTQTQTYRYECSPPGRPSDRVSLEWRTIVVPSNGRDPPRALEVTRLDWNGRSPTADELAALNAALRPYFTPRSASLFCGRDDNLLTLEMWEVRNGAARIAIAMDAQGFRLVPPAVPR